MSRKSSNTKKKIVKAAWDLFYKQGYDATTIEEIVEVSQTSKGSFYHYFESKDSLLASLSYLFDEKYEELECEISGNDNVFDTLIYLNQELFDMMDNELDQVLVAKLYSTQLDMKGEKSLMDSSRFYYRLLKTLMIKGQKSGEFTSDMTVNDMVRYYAMCERALITEWCLRDFSFSLKNYSKQMLPLMLTGLKNRTPESFK